MTDHFVPLVNNSNKQNGQPGTDEKKEEDEESEEVEEDDLTCATGDITIRVSNCKMPTKEEVKKALAIVLDYLNGAEVATVSLKHLIFFVDDLTGSNEALHAKAQEEIAAMLEGKNNKLQNDYDLFLKAARVLQEHVAAASSGYDSLSDLLYASLRAAKLKAPDAITNRSSDPLSSLTESDSSLETISSRSLPSGIFADSQAGSSHLSYSESSKSVLHGEQVLSQAGPQLPSIDEGTAVQAVPNLLPANEGGIGRMFKRLMDCCRGGWGDEV